MVAATVVFASVWALVRHATESVDPLQIVFFRQLIGLLAILPLLRHGGPSLLRTHRFGTHMLRALTGVTAAFCTFLAIAKIPLGDVVAISYAAPLLTTLAAFLLLGEPARLRRILAVLVGFGGMLLVMRPGSQAMQWGHLIALAGSVCVAASMISIRTLTSTEHPRTIVFYNFLLGLPISLLAVVPVWQWPSGGELGLLVAIGLGAFVAQMLIVRAFAHSEASVLMPFDFLRLVLASALGYFLFAEKIDAYTATGALIILLATIYLARREYGARR
ncbi:MAG: DMT family transporter [Sphingomonadales bacterium]